MSRGRRLSCLLLLGLLPACNPAELFGGGRRGSVPVALPAHEFVGPFPSWANLKTGYGAKGDGVADDTGPFQTALDQLGTTGKPTVLFVPAGTYRITAGLLVKLRTGVSIIGADPATTTIS